MQGLDEFLWPYLISQVASIVILLVTLFNTRWGRVLFLLLFLWAGVTNLYFGLIDPEIYIEYARLALPFYRDFINGWFTQYNAIIIPLIAIGQLLIAAGMLLKGWWFKWACIGSILFLISIAPLMVGSAFPFSITVSIAALVLLKRDDANYLWRRQVEHNKISMA